MTILLWSAIVLTVTPIVLAGVTGYHRVKQLGTLDNDHPRAQFAALTGAGARCHAAQQNAWEALTVFIASAGAALLAGVDPGAMATTALVVVGARIAHAGCYLAGLATLRSVVFVIGYAACLHFFVLALAV